MAGLLLYDCASICAGGDVCGPCCTITLASLCGTLNPKPSVQVEMYADPIARGGVLEPEGIVEIKFRVPDLLKAMHRLDPVIRGLKDEAEPDWEAQIKARETALLPVYRQVCSPVLQKRARLAGFLTEVMQIVRLDWASDANDAAVCQVCTAGSVLRLLLRPCW